MTSNFDDSPSQSTNSTSSNLNLNSFPSNSRIWSSSVGTSALTPNKHSNNLRAGTDDSLLDSISIAIRSDPSAVDFHNSNITVDEYYHLLNTDNVPSPSSGVTATATATTAPFIPNSSSSWRFDGINTNSNVAVNASLNGNHNHAPSSARHSFSDADYGSNFSSAPVPASSSSFSGNINSNSIKNASICLDKRNLFASNLNRDPISVSNLNSDSSLALPNQNYNQNHKNNRYHAQGQGYINMHQQIMHPSHGNASHGNASHMNQHSQQQHQHQQQRSQLQNNLNARAPPNNGQSQYHTEDISATMQGMHMDAARTDSNVNVNVNPSSTGIYPNQMQHGHGSAAGYSIMDPLENILGPFPCVRLRNLPYDATVEDVLLFFHGLMMLDIIILPPPVFHGQHHQVQSCEAFVLFANPADFQMAFQRHRQQMRHGSYVDVFQGKRQDYYAAVSSQFMHFQQVHRRGEESHRSASPYAPSNIPTQSLRGSANVSASMNVNAQHLQHMSMHQAQPGPAPLPGTRPRSSRSDSRGKVAGRGSGRGGGIQIGEHTGYLRMRGLPFTTTKNDIFEFFEGYEPIEDSICLTYRSDGRATGEGYVGFVSVDGAERAMDLHKKSLGSRYIELFISNKEEHGRAKTREPPPESPTPSDQSDA